MLNNKVHLITYPDSLGTNLKDLKHILEKYLKKYIYGIHILPAYPSSTDRGFSPLTHLTIDPKFGNYNDIKDISKNYSLTLDLIANHISSESKYFQDYIKKSNKSIYKDLFLKKEDVFKEEKIKQNQLKKIFRPRETLPYFPVKLCDGTTKYIWSTFSPQQIDLNWNNQITHDLIKEFLNKIISSGAQLIRLDAIGFICKKSNTNSFFLPEVYQIISELKNEAKKTNKNIKFLAEVHKDYKLENDIARKVDYIYDFSLPALILYSLNFQDFKPLKNWIKIRPNNQINVLDTHDGIGISDIKGQLNKSQIQKLKEKLYIFGGIPSLKKSSSKLNEKEDYQINITYYSALNCEDKKYLLARAIQLFLPGISQIYYVGLLYGENDLELFSKTNIKRDINRHQYSIKEIETKINEEKVKKLFELIKFRNTYNAFDGNFKIYKTKKEILKLQWNKGNYKTTLYADLKNENYQITYIQNNIEKELNIF